MLAVSVQLCGQAAGSEGELDEEAAGGDHDQDGCTRQGIHEGQTVGTYKEIRNFFPDPELFVSDSARMNEQNKLKWLFDFIPVDLNCSIYSSICICSVKKKIKDSWYSYILLFD